MYNIQYCLNYILRMFGIFEYVLAVPYRLCVKFNMKMLFNKKK